MKKIALLALIATSSAVVLAPSAHAATANVSDGTTPASGTTVVTMTVPKFAEVRGIDPTLNFTVTPAEYAAGQSTVKNLKFRVRTNSTAGLTVSVAGSADATGELNNADVALTSDGASGITLNNTAQTIWANTAPIATLPTTPNVNLGVQVNTLSNYTVAGTGAAATQAYTKTLTFTVLPN